jgi:hypothetical protein
MHVLFFSIASLVLAMSPPALPRTAPHAIDCAGFSQPCTGTVCVHQTTQYACGPELNTCDNDTQRYTGGDFVCCTDRTPCFVCFENNKSSQVYSYVGTAGSCVANN